MVFELFRGEMGCTLCAIFMHLEWFRMVQNGKKIEVFQIHLEESKALVKCFYKQKLIVG